MEFAVYRVYFDGDGRKMGAFVYVLASRMEAEARAQNLDGEHEVVGLYTREISEEDSDRWGTVVFLEDGDVRPVDGER